MTQISSIGAGLYTDMAMAVPSSPIDVSTLGSATVDTTWKDFFDVEINSAGGTKATDTFVRIKNVREFPSIGTPPNIVNVPVYGQSQSQQIQGQSDAPSVELSLNFVATDWADGSILGDAVGDGNQYVFRFALMNSMPGGYSSDAINGPSDIGAVENSLYFWIGKLEALLVNPQLTDATTATVTMSVQSAFFGAFTVD